MKKIINYLRLAATVYEPVAFRAIVGSIWGALALGGIVTGELPAKAEAALAVSAIVIPLVLSFMARAKVSPTGTEGDTGKGEHDVDLHPEGDVDNPDDDFADEPGAHKRED